MNEYQATQDYWWSNIPIFVPILVHLLIGYTLMKMAQKTGHADKAWWGFIPILNFLLLVKIAGKPNWWFLLCLIPIVNLGVLMVLWIEAAPKCRLSPIWGVLVLTPIIGLFALAKFALPSNNNSKPMAAPEQPRQPTPVG